MTEQGGIGRLGGLLGSRNSVRCPVPVQTNTGSSNPCVRVMLGWLEDERKKSNNHQVSEEPPRDAGGRAAGFSCPNLDLPTISTTPFRENWHSSKTQPPNHLQPLCLQKPPLPFQHPTKFPAVFENTIDWRTAAPSGHTCGQVAGGDPQLQQDQPGAEVAQGVRGVRVVHLHEERVGRVLVGGERRDDAGSVLRDRNERCYSKARTKQGASSIWGKGGGEPSKLLSLHPLQEIVTNSSHHELPQTQ